MLVLGIETSCDETAAAIVRDGKEVLSNIVASSIRFHKRFGGVVPEIASRRQLELIYSVVKSCLSHAAVKLSELELLAVTNQPGLVSSLLVGRCFANALSLALGRPLISIDHLQAHLYAAFLEKESLCFPFMGLVISGGHTSLFFVEDISHFRLLGQTRDDAVGEAFDKVARILNLGYPGGPIIERLARKGNPKRVKFGCARLKHSFDFSFSGIKTAVLYHIRDKRQVSRLEDIAASFQEAVVEVLVNKSLRACEEKGIRFLVVGGGVAANSYLRSRLKKEAKMRMVEVLFPPKRFCLDNAAMVAGLGCKIYRRGG